ncbi:GGDEF domain-containing protein [Thiomicrorhabdus sediminis]|uniref:diguanylate cyclase n=1 Tax=Thiomicrorhabdus sediminis TaxID=2580412 RepID=A0A4P9K4U6_9GAMM|nr:GGDEF domain-containing protein [Thiomicrorhabdus sediminis]QCU89972.1 GGDEF domain-containing protein [Thiomicrorhabdus sediminis]
MIQYSQPVNKSRDIYQSITEKFSQIKINPTPINYTVWYEYFLGSNLDLNAEINDLLRNSKHFPDRLGLRLYEQYIEKDEPHAQTQYDAAVASHVQQTSHQMDVLKQNMAQHSKTMQSYADNLTVPNLQGNDIENLAQNIRSVTELMESDTNKICDDLQSSSQQVKLLRKQLEQARAEAHTDDLTQVGNRKAFNKALQYLSIEQSETEQPLCLIMTDIDHFKSFNDTYGHPVGDSVLRYFAKIMTQEAEENETVCRYGGEEFAILMKNTSIEQATRRAEQIRQKIASCRLTLKGEKKPIKPITASFGVALFKGKIESLDEFINRADKSLYRAKEFGRNQVVHEQMMT